MIKTILTGFVLGLILILFVPAILILASWNAVPGDSTYSIKVGLEKAILGVTPSDNLKTALEIKYTERRFTEVEKIISNNNINFSINGSQNKYLDESLNNLTKQAIASKNSLQKIQNSDEKIAQTESLISTLESISSKIEEKKQTSNTTSTPTKIPTKVPTKIPTKIPTNTPVVIKPDTISQPITPDKPSPTFTPTPISTLIPTSIPTPVEDDNPTNPPDLDGTQEIIDGIIDELRGENTTQSTSENQTEKNNSKRTKDNSPKEDNQNKYQDSKEKRDHRP